MRFLKSVSRRLDEASTAGKEKKTKNTAAFAHSPFTTTAFVIMAVFFVFFSLAGVASANEPWWHIESGSAPANIPPGGEGKITVTVSDLGDANANGGTGSPIKIVDTLPPGLKATAVVPHPVGPATAIVTEADYGMSNGFQDGIGVASQSVGVCTETPVLECEYTGVLADYNQIQVIISVKAEAGAHT